MQDILETIISRRSVKSYKSDMVPDGLIEKVIKAGTYAPSGMNKQSPIIVAITNKEVRDNLSKTVAQMRGRNDFDPFYNAPVVLVVLADKNNFTHVYDGSLVVQNMLLEAHSLGLGACWIHWCKEAFESEYGKSILSSLGLDPDSYEGIGHCILGYPETKPEGPLSRKENYVYYIR
jgi:nitroreductase